MTNSSCKPAKVFTVERANAMLPLVRAIVGDMVSLSREVRERRERLDQLSSGREPQGDDPYLDELQQVEEELEKDASRLQEFEDELLQLGVEPRDPEEGLVDFPSMLDGRGVFLCWQYGEPDVQYWHESDAGHSERKPLTVGATFGDAESELADS